MLKQNKDPVLSNNIGNGNLSLIEVFAEVAAVPPPIGVNTTCRPRKLPRLSNVSFSIVTGFLCRLPSCQNQTGLTGERLKRKRKIILMLLFAFEVDTLEIALREQLEFVDKIFIVESSMSHKRVKELYSIVQ